MRGHTIRKDEEPVMGRVGPRAQSENDFKGVVEMAWELLAQ